MSYSIFIDYSIDDFINRIITDYNKRVKNSKFEDDKNQNDKDNDIKNKINGLNGLFYENLPIFVSQSEGIKKYLIFKLTEKNKVLLNINSFNLQSFFKEYVKPYLSFENSDDLTGPEQDNKNTIFFYLYNYFYSTFSRSFQDFCEKQNSNSNINFKINNEASFIESDDFKKFVNFLIIFSDLYEQYETFRDFDEWEILKNQNISNIDKSDIDENLIQSICSFDENGKLKINDQIYNDSFQISLIKLIINSQLENNSQLLNAKYQLQNIKYQLKNTKYHILKRIRNENIKPKFPKNPLFFIAFDSIPYFYFIFLKKISEFVDINFYFLLPTESFFEEEKKEKSEIATSLFDDEFELKNEGEDKDKDKNQNKNQNENGNGNIKSYFLSFCLKRQKEFINEFLSYFKENHFINNSESNIKDSTTLLEKYQLFLKATENKRKSLFKSCEPDNSIQILSNYTELRELEVIKDKILEVLSKDSSLKYEDFIIMAVDISKYLPYIEIVFKFQEPSLPVFIVDKDISENSEIFKVINIFLDLLSNNFKKSDFIDFISSELIMKKFDLELKDIEIFKILFSNYLYGSDFDDITQYFAKDGFNSLNPSFDFSIESQFLSHTIGYISSNSYLENDAFIEFNDNKIIHGETIASVSHHEGFKEINQRIIPINTEIEGEFIERVEKIYLVYIHLLYLYKFSKNLHRIEEYRDFFERFFDYLISDSEEYHQYILYYRNKINRFFDEIDKYKKDNQNNKKENNKENSFISFEILKLILQNYLKSHPYSYGWTTGNILFSNMISLRNVPAKVVAILGLNDIDFPRKSTNISFDLMLKDKKAWDRDIRESDKYLFLESVLSAKNFLFLSYIGKNPKDNKERAPSIALKILQEDINTNLLKEGSLVKIQMSIQPFSKKYYFNNFDITNDFKTYNKSWKSFLENLLRNKDENQLYVNQNNNIEDLSVSLVETGSDKKNEQNDQDKIVNKSNCIDLKDFINFIKNPLKFYLQKVLNADIYLSDYNFDNEFDQYISSKNIEKAFIDLLKLKIKNNELKCDECKEKTNENDEENNLLEKQDQNETNKNLINYLKLKYLKPRGILTEYDFNLLDKKADCFAIKLKKTLKPRSDKKWTKISIKNVSKKLKFENSEFEKKHSEYAIKGYTIKFSYYEIFIDDKKQFLFFYSDFEFDFFYNIFYLFLINLFEPEDLVEFDFNDKKTKSILVQLPDSDYYIEIKNTSNENNSNENKSNKNNSNENYNNCVEINDKKGLLDKIKENIELLNKDILNLLYYYYEMIINQKFLPVSLIDVKKDSFTKYIEKLNNSLSDINKIIDIMENKIFGKYSNNDNKDILDFYEKKAFEQFLIDIKKRENHDYLNEYIKSIYNLLKFYKEIKE